MPSFDYGSTVEIRAWMSNHIPLFYILGCNYLSISQTWCWYISWKIPWLCAGSQVATILWLTAPEWREEFRFWNGKGNGVTEKKSIVGVKRSHSGKWRVIRLQESRWVNYERVQTTCKFIQLLILSYSSNNHETKRKHPERSWSVKRQIKCCPATQYARLAANWGSSWTTMKHWSVTPKSIAPTAPSCICV